MTFKEILKLPLSKDDPTTVAQAVCAYLNRAYRKYGEEEPSCVLGYDVFVFHCPDHEIQEDEIFAHIAWDYMPLFAQEPPSSLKTLRELSHVWSRTCFLNQPRDFESL